MSVGQIRRRVLQGAGVAVVVMVTLLLVDQTGAPMPPQPMTGSDLAGEVIPTQTPTPVAPLDPEAAFLGGRAQSSPPKDEFVSVWDLPAGSLVLNPVSGRQEVIDFDVAKSAILFGDSQSAGARGVSSGDTWVARGLAAQGYKVRFVGAEGIGFTATTSKSGSFLSSLVSGQVVLPYGNPPLVVVQGGGNDAGTGASDAAILSNAEGLLRELQASYPTSTYLFIGTLSRGSQADRRRIEVDNLLAGFAQRNGVAFVSAGDWLTRYGVSNKMADAVHLNPSGHQELAKALTARMNQLGIHAPAPAGGVPK